MKNPKSRIAPPLASPDRIALDVAFAMASDGSIAVQAASRDQGRLSSRRFFELFLGRVPLRIVRKIWTQARTDLHPWRADGDSGGALGRFAFAIAGSLDRRRGLGSGGEGFSIHRRGGQSPRLYFGGTPVDQTSGRPQGKKNRRQPTRIEHGLHRSRRGSAARPQRRERSADRRHRRPRRPLDGAYVRTDPGNRAAISVYTQGAQGRLSDVYRFFQRGF